ncbi:MAG: RNA pyrophosphohydrolase [Succinivibrionaceae bacterium]|nr:RNA pyrophosphohydrolase [Succinivibrionaceae bacterium]
MIDHDGYRYNVGIVVCNRTGQLLWARRIGQNSWQFPQGGVDQGESPEQAMYRELKEELGLAENDVVLVDQTRYWLKYKLPKRLVHSDTSPVCIGQKQKWFLLLLSEEKEQSISFDATDDAEFDSWRWVSYWYPIRQVVSFKRDVYRRVLREFLIPTQRSCRPTIRKSPTDRSYQSRKHWC